MSAEPDLEHDRGETLLELIMAIVILGVCVVAIGSGIAISIKVSDINRSQSIASEYLHNYAEQVQGGAYQLCASGTPNYASGLTAPANGGSWTISQSNVKYWNGSTFSSTCPAADTLQQVTIRLQSGGGFVDESIVFAVRNPS